MQIRNSKIGLQRLINFIILCLVLLSLMQFTLVQAEQPAQVPTGSIPTVTGTPVGAIALVLDSEQGIVNVRSGPSTLDYDIIGVLVVGQEVPALGRSPVGDWVQIAYPGVTGGVAWIYSDLVQIRGTLPIIEPPATPTLQVTPTIDPTLAAQFLVEIPPTSKPTFTEPPPLSLPTLPSQTGKVETVSRIPMGLLIIGMAVVGLFGLLISFLGGR